MPSWQYQVRIPFRGVYAAEGKGIVEIPEHAILSVVRSPPGERFTIVNWNGCELLVFLEDLVARAVVIEVRAA
jgi:hypothetical protein